NPGALAEDLMVSLRQSSWCGRHRFMVFGVLPLLGFPLFWGLILCASLAAGFGLGYGWSPEELQAAADNPGNLAFFVSAIQCAGLVAIGLVTLLFSRLAGRSAAGRKWMLLAGVICAIYALFIYAHVSHHRFTVGLTWEPQWIQGAVPLLIVWLGELNRQR